MSGLSDVVLTPERYPATHCSPACDVLFWRVLVQVPQEAEGPAPNTILVSVMLSAHAGCAANAPIAAAVTIRDIRLIIPSNALLAPSHVLHARIRRSSLDVSTASMDQTDTDTRSPRGH